MESEERSERSPGRPDGFRPRVERDAHAPTAADPWPEVDLAHDIPNEGVDELVQERAKSLSTRLDRLPIGFLGGEARRGHRRGEGLDPGGIAGARCVAPAERVRPTIVHPWQVAAAGDELDREERGSSEEAHRRADS